MTTTTTKPRRRAIGETAPVDPGASLDLGAEGVQLLPVMALARQYCGRSVSGPTIWRWIQEGLSDGAGGKIRLQAAWSGGRWCTTRDAMAGFIRAQTAAKLQRHQPVDATTDELEAEGLS